MRVILKKDDMKLGIAVQIKIQQIILCCMPLFCSSLYATPATPLHETWTSVRALGMGNAYTAIVDDADALFYNPAGLARISGINWTIIDIHAGLDDVNIVQTVKDFQSASSNISSFLSNQYGKKHWVNAATKTAVYIPNFAVAAFGNADVLMMVDNPPYPQLTLDYYADYGGAAGFGFEAIPGFLRFGIDTKYIYRLGTESVFTADQLASLNTTAITNAITNKGTGYAFDTGMVLSIPGPIKPSLSFVWKNMGVTAFSHDSGPAAPPRILDEMIVGGALQISLPLISITPAFDYKYANRAELPFSKKISMGLEVSLPLIEARAGINQGYYCLGVGVHLPVIHIEAATYGEELGEYAGQIEDRRYMVELTFDIGFDLFGLLSGGGSSSSGGKGGSSGSQGGGSYRPSLKQRR